VTPADHIVRQCHMYMTLDVGFNCRYRVAAQLNLKVYTDAVEQMVRKVFKV
jgi:hypothetical protein